jgi:FtsZ-binding cell division protein ZapB
MKSKLANPKMQHDRHRWRARAFLPPAAVSLLCFGAMSPGQDQVDGKSAGAATLEETRLMMGKWIETQQIISKERNDWQQGKEILVSRLELVKKEIAGLAEKIEQAQTNVSEAQAKRDVLRAQNEQLVATGAQLASAVTAMEDEVRRLFKTLPEPIQVKLQPLHQRIPEDPANTRVSVAERFQNVLGILNELNKANNEITVNYEVRDLADGKPSEVQALYIGLAQAYYVCANGQAGVGRPTNEGWKWEPSNSVGRDVVTALEIIQGKHSPAFVPLPVKLQ